MLALQYKKPNLIIYAGTFETAMELLFYTAGIHAEFPSPALEFKEVTIDIIKHLIKHPTSAFYALAKDDSMKGCGINAGDILIIDRNLDIADDKIAVCYLDGIFTLKRIRKTKTEIWLVPENGEFQPVQVTEENTFLVWGIIQHTIKSY